MRKRSDLREYQRGTVKFQRSKLFWAIWAKMGAGKTVSTLTSLSDLLDELFAVKVLIIAPLRVANTVWAQEAQGWEHLRHLEFSIVTGTMKERREALAADADIYVINRENVKWLVEYYGKDWPFDTVVIDEASSFKDHTSKRFKALRKVRKYINRFGELTGSPAPEGYIGLWAQIFLLDQGTRLGRTITGYRKRWFDPDYLGYNYEIKPGAAEEIRERIEDIVYVVNNYDGMPAVDHQVARVPLGQKLDAGYRDFERENLLALDATEIEAATAGALTNKLLQYAQGAVYDEDRHVHHIHDKKIEALREIVDDAQGEPILVAYSFRHDLDRLKKAFPKAKTLSKSGAEIEAWNRGEIPMLIVHPQSAGHGLNLQFGGHVIVWFGLTWSLEYYEQLNARLARSGQAHEVIIHHLLAEGTMDEVVYEALQSKAGTQDDLVAAVQAVQGQIAVALRQRAREVQAEAA